MKDVFELQLQHPTSKTIFVIDIEVEHDVAKHQLYDLGRYVARLEMDRSGPNLEILCMRKKPKCEIKGEF